MKTLVGMNVIKSKKSGKRFLMLNLLDDAYFDSMNHADLFASPEQTGWGQTVSTEFLDLEDPAQVEIHGDLEPGCSVRIFKENVEGMDRITLIQVTGKKK